MRCGKDISLKARIISKSLRSEVERGLGRFQTLQGSSEEKSGTSQIYDYAQGDVALSERPLVLFILYLFFLNFFHLGKQFL